MALSLVVQMTSAPLRSHVVAKLAWAAGLQTWRGLSDSPLVQYVQKTFCANWHVVVSALTRMLASQLTNCPDSAVVRTTRRRCFRCSMILLALAVPVLGLHSGEAGVQTLPDRLAAKQG
jgi:hypothetical protein